MKWYCNICNELFNNRKDFYSHRKTLKHYEQLKCQYCGNSYRRGSPLKNHETYCDKNTNKSTEYKGCKWTQENKLKLSNSMKKAHQEGRAFSWADLSKRKEHSYPEKWLILVLQNEFNLVEHLDYDTEVKFHTFSLDFVFPNKKVIEMDGLQHKRSEYQKDCDMRKDELLKKEGWRELRIDWSECMKNKIQTISKISEFLKI